MFGTVHCEPKQPKNAQEACNFPSLLFNLISVGGQPTVPICDKKPMVANHGGSCCAARRKTTFQCEESFQAQIVMTEQNPKPEPGVRRTELVTCAYSSDSRPARFFENAKTDPEQTSVFVFRAGRDPEPNIVLLFLLAIMINEINDSNKNKDFKY